MFRSSKEEWASYSVDLIYNMYSVNIKSNIKDVDKSNCLRVWNIRDRWGNKILKEYTSWKHWPDQALSSESKFLNLKKSCIRMSKKHPSILKLLNLKFHPHENHFNNNGIIVFLLLYEQSIDNNDRPLNVFFKLFWEV